MGGGDRYLESEFCWKILYHILSLCLHGQGGGGSAKCGQVSAGGRGSNITENVQTSFTDDPKFAKFWLCPQKLEEPVFYFYTNKKQPNMPWPSYNEAFLRFHLTIHIQLMQKDKGIYENTNNREVATCNHLLWTFNCTTYFS